MIYLLLLITILVKIIYRCFFGLNVKNNINQLVLYFPGSKYLFNDFHPLFAHMSDRYSKKILKSNQIEVVNIN